MSLLAVTFKCCPLFVPAPPPCHWAEMINGPKDYQSPDEHSFCLWKSQPDIYSVIAMLLISPLE